MLFFCNSVLWNPCFIYFWKEERKMVSFYFTSHAIYDVENVYFYRRCKTSSFSLTHTFLPEKENCHWTCTKIHILCISVFKKTYILHTKFCWVKHFLHNFSDWCVNFFQNISFKILFLSSLGHLFIPYKIFPTPPRKKPNKPHTHIHPPTHTLNKTETHILNYHLRFWHWWFLWRIDKTSGLTKYVVLLGCQGAD